MNSKVSMPPLLLSPRQLLLAELNGTLSQWEHGHDHPVIGPTTARDLLAHWAGLRRLAGDPLGDERGARLDQLVHSAVMELAERMLPLGAGFAAAWRHRAEELSITWDSARLEDHDDIAWSAQLLFEDLDRLQLAIWTLGELLPVVSPMRPVLEQFATQTAEAERFLIERPDLFIDRVAEFAEALSATRPNLEEECPELWATLLKHRRIEEEQESVETGLAPLQLFAAAARFQCALGCVVTAGEPNVAHAADVEYAQAAGAGNGDAILHRLATDNPAACRGDYRRLWARFLACCHEGTTPAADCLRLFLEATAAAGAELSGDWKERVQRVQGLCQQRDWEDHYEGTGVFLLEPRRLHTEGDLVRWLHELQESSHPS